MAGDAEQFGDIGHRLIVVEVFAGKDIQAEVAPLGEGVNADVAFGDEHEAGYPPIFRHLAVILEDVRGHDLGHVDQVRAVIQEFIYEVQVRQLLITASIAIQSQMQSEARHRFFQ